jgi:antitoxin Phd
MSIWPIDKAKARFDELMNSCLKNGPQTLTRTGKPVAVLVSFEAWESAAISRGPDLKSWLMTPMPRGDLAIPPRGKAKSRRPPSFE